MWILSLTWLLAALLVFWITGAFKRLRRMRQQAVQALGAVHAQLQALQAVLQDAASTCGDATVAQALHKQAQALKAAADHAHAHPWQRSAIGALRQCWQASQALWALHGNSVTSPSEPDTSTGQDARVSASAQWEEVTAQLYLKAVRFDALVHEYNQAIAQAPACVLARLSGFKPGRFLLKDAA